MTSVIILAAGVGARMNLGYNKMNLKFNNKPLYLYIIEKFKSLGYDDIIVVCNDDIKDVDCVTAKGGDIRMMSVYNGLKKAKYDYVMIHDGARPFVNDLMIKQIEEELNHYDAVLLAKRVTDTIKVLENGKLKTLDRSKLIAAETPQAFKKDIIINSIEKAISDGYEPTDDVSLIEKYMSDIPVKVIYDEYPNLKLTTQSDLVYANYLFSKENEEWE